MKLLLASQNQHKKIEMKEIFDSEGIELLDLSSFHDNDDVEEDGDTFLDNAMIKALYFSKKYSMPAISDDSGIVIKALGGGPGVYSKRYSGGSDLDNNLKVLEEMKGKTNRDAYFVSVIVIAFPDGKCFSYVGRVHGLIGFELKGNNGFGYDSIFYVPSYDKHMAELPSEVKNKISHRALALKQVKEHLHEIINYK